MTLKGAAYATLLISLLNVIDSLGLSIQFVHQIPLASLGFNWILPVVIAGIIGNFIPSKKANKAQ